MSQSRVLTLLLCLLLIAASHCGNVVIGNGNKVKGNGNYIDHADENNITGDENQLRESFRNHILGSLNGLFRTNNLNLQGNGMIYNYGIDAQQQQGNLQTESSGRN